MKNRIDNQKWYVDNFNLFKSSNKNVFSTLSNKAIEKFKTLEFPTKKDEEWKYININPLLKNNFLPSSLSANSSVNLETIEEYTLDNLDVYRFVFVNGIFNSELSTGLDFGKDIIAGSLSNLLNKNDTRLEKLFDIKNKLQKDNNIFNLLNTAFLHDGFLLYLPKDTVIDKPFHVINISTGNNKLLNQPHNLIHLESNSKAEIIFEYLSEKATEHFTNIVTEISLDENANLNVYKIQNESPNAFHIENSNILQKNSSVVKHFSLSFGALITRNNINAELDGENVENNLYGLYLGNKNQQIDNHTFIEHIKPNSNSNELYKGILDDDAKGIFSGKILVQKEAQKTNAFQSNKSVLLSNKAISDSKPQLEIYADDVKCSHGATVGKLDQEALFYIRSRGVPLELARSMLIRAFIDDVVKEISIEQLREKINHTIFQHLKRVEF